MPWLRLGTAAWGQRLKQSDPGRSRSPGGPLPGGGVTGQSCRYSAYWEPVPRPLPSAAISFPWGSSEFWRGPATFQNKAAL